MLGLLHNSSTAPSPSDRAATPLPGGLVVPARLIDQSRTARPLERFRGAAVAITGVEPNGKPNGVAVIHPGEHDLPRGLIETGLQALPPAEPIGGFKVYQLEGQVWIAVTEHCSSYPTRANRLPVRWRQLQNQESDSLAKQPGFSRLAADRESALAFVYVNGSRTSHRWAPPARPGGDDGPHVFGSRTLGERRELRHHGQGPARHAKVVLAEGHRNLAYGMVPTAPVTKHSLAHVPAGAAAVAVLGLDPAAQPAQQAAPRPPSLSAMDIGREVFANVEELSLFVIPAERGDAAGGIPEIGVIAAVKDPAKSEALWDQLLSLAAMFGPQVVQPPQEVEIEGRKGREYQFTGAPPIVVVRVGDRTMAAGTRGTVAQPFAQRSPMRSPAIRSSSRCWTASSPKAARPSSYTRVVPSALPPWRCPAKVHKARQIADLVGDLPLNGRHQRAAKRIVNSSDGLGTAQPERHRASRPRGSSPGTQRPSTNPNARAAAHRKRRASHHPPLRSRPRHPAALALVVLRTATQPWHRNPTR